MRIKKKTGWRWLILGMVNALVVLISAWMLLEYEPDEVSAGFLWQDESETSLKRIYSTSKMKQGVYEVSVHYTGGDDSYVLSCSAKGDGGRYPILFADEHQMPHVRNEISFRLWINSDIDSMLMDIASDKTAPEISIDSIVFKRNFRLTFTYLMLQLGVMLLLLDLAVVVLWNRRILGRWVRENIYVVLGLLGILCIASSDVFTVSQITGHDIPFHFARITGLAEGLLAGEFPVKIQPGWCNGYGYAVSVFYGDKLLYFPAILYILGVPLMYTYKVYLFFIHIATIGITYYCYRVISSDKYIGLVCTALSILSVNRILNVQVRAAVGEYSAYMFLPLVLLGMWKIICREEEISSGRKTNGWLILGLGMTGVLQTHILSFEMVCIVLGIVTLILIKKLWGNRLRELIKGAVLTICLNVGFIIPFLDYSRQDLRIFDEKYEYGYEYGIQKLGLSLYELFSLPTSGAGTAITAEKGLLGRFPISLGLSVTAVIVLTLITLLKLKWEEQERKKLLFVLGIAGMCIWMTTYYFPWNRLAAVRGIRNVVFSIQFPWRFLSLGIPLMTCVACLVLRKIKGSILWGQMKYLLLGLYLLTVVQGMYTTDLAMRRGHVVLYDASEYLRSDARLLGAEYLFKDTSWEDTRSNRDVSGQNVTVTEVSREGNRITATCNAATDAYLEFPIFAYAYYRCIDMETGIEFPIAKGENNKIRVELPADYQGTLTVLFREPWYWRAAEMFSLSVFLILCSYGCYMCYMQRKRIECK